MIFGEILDSFIVNSEKVFIIKFNDGEYRPSMGGKVLFKGVSFNIKPFGFGKHDYYKHDLINVKDVWSCTLVNFNEDIEANIPNGSTIIIEL